MPTVFAARQFVNHGHIKVNGRRVNIASYQVKVGDLVEIKESSRQMALVLEANALAERDVPDYIEVDHAKGTAKMTRIPASPKCPIRRTWSRTWSSNSTRADASQTHKGPSSGASRHLLPQSGRRVRAPLSRVRGRAGVRAGRPTAEPSGSHADASLRNRGPASSSILPASHYSRSTTRSANGWSRITASAN